MPGGRKVVRFFLAHSKLIQYATNKNSVELIGHYGSDEVIALSAWTSTSRDLSEEKRARIPALIRQLWNAEPVPHGTPFEKASVHFLITCDIASHIHLLKHRISSLNAESARYKKLKEDRYHIPDDLGGNGI
jgi:Predicted alternative thymidylate synthase